MISPIRVFAAGAAATISLLLLSSTPVSAASIDVAAAVGVGPGSFHYDYSIANTGPDDLLVLDVPVPSSASAVQNLAAPNGFSTSFDSGLGVVSFLEDGANFGPVATSGFSFDSPFAPGPVTFTGTELSAATGDLFTVQGPTVGPGGTVGAVPEPGYLGLLAVLAAIPLAAKKRLRKIFQQNSNERRRNENQ